MTPTADVSVREATSADVSAIAQVQVQTWREAYGNILPRDVLDGLDPAAVEARWRASIEGTPPPARTRWSRWTRGHGRRRRGVPRHR